MRVILTKDVPKIGRKGEVVTVAEGYARNFLFKQNAAILATDAEIAKLKAESAHKSEKAEKLKKKFLEYKKDLEKRIFSIKVKSGDKGQIFGGVHEKDIISAVYQKTKIELDKSQFKSLHGIKNLGEYPITIRLGQGINATIKIKIETNG